MGTGVHMRKERMSEYETKFNAPKTLLGYENEIGEKSLEQGLKLLQSYIVSGSKVGIGG
jgi:hypothetical protein